MAALPHFLAQRRFRQLSEAADRARDSGAWQEAAQLYADLCRAFPLSAALHVQRGNMLKESGRYEDARQAYEVAGWLQPGEADVWLQLGHLAKLQDRFAEAATAYRRSHDLDPSRPDAARELAHLEQLEEFAAEEAGLAWGRRRSLPRTQFSSASASMLMQERLRVSLAHQPR